MNVRIEIPPGYELESLSLKKKQSQRLTGTTFYTTIGKITEREIIENRFGHLDEGTYVIQPNFHKKGTNRRRTNFRWGKPFCQFKIIKMNSVKKIIQL